MSIQSIIKQSDRILDSSMKIIIIFITFMAACTMFLQVISRYVFEIAISGLDEITGHTAVWLYLMGAAYGSFNRSQIKAEMAHLVIKNRRVLYLIRAIATSIAVVVACFMVSWSFEYIQWSIKKHEITPTLQLPTVIFQISILIGAILMVFFFIREAIDYLRKAFAADPATE